MVHMRAQTGESLHQQCRVLLILSRPPLLAVDEFSPNEDTRNVFIKGWPAESETCLFIPYRLGKLKELCARVLGGSARGRFQNELRSTRFKIVPTFSCICLSQTRERERLTLLFSDLASLVWLIFLIFLFDLVVREARASLGRSDALPASAVSGPDQHLVKLCWAMLGWAGLGWGWQTIQVDLETG